MLAFEWARMARRASGLTRSAPAFDADLVCPPQQTASWPALHQNQVLLLLLEYSDVADVKIVPKLAVQYFFAEIKGHPY